MFMQEKTNEQEYSSSIQKISITEEETNEPEEQYRPDELVTPEGELAIDVWQTGKDVVIQTAIAGVRPEEVDVSIENDVVSIRGLRRNPAPEETKDYLHQECFWGAFSRQIFLPEEIDIKNVEAAMKDGVLTLRLPKLYREKTKKVKISKK